MPKLPILSGKEVIKILAKFGYEVDHQTGSHMNKTIWINKGRIYETFIEITSLYFSKLKISRKPYK